jgi:hypothetical protein
MPIPPIPPPLDSLGNRPFSFYPAILNIEHNEWLYRKATWSEVLVTNVKTGEDLWIPRRFLGELSRIDDPVVIVGLNKELEYRGGAVWPYQRRVIQMPLAVNDKPHSAPIPSRSEPAPVIGIRVESTESRLGRLVGIALACGTVACILVVVMSRQGEIRPKASSSTRDQMYEELRPTDDFFAVDRKLGHPARDRWESETGAMQFRALSYPQGGYTVILMGTDRSSAHYIGTLDGNWHEIHSTTRENSALLRELHKF